MYVCVDMYVCVYVRTYVCVCICVCVCVYVLISLSPNRLKKQLKGRHISSDMEAIAATET